MNSTLSVTELNKYIKRLIEKDSLMSKVTVAGELSNFTDHKKTGHFYMTLKDNSSAIKAVMFKDAASKVLFRPENGMEVILTGRISVFERDGAYQLYVTRMEPVGLGALHLAYEQLKSKLEEEGLFDARYKKPIPKLPTKVGVVTAPDGAAVQDIINVLGRRFPLAKVLVCPALVQGENAAPDIVRGIEYFNDKKPCDVLIVGRGDGGIEDLWAFNDERVARAIFKSNIPIISAVGHETDFTIADFVADLRAPTPSAAAELAVPDMLTLKHRFANLDERMYFLFSKNIERKRERLRNLSERKVLTDPKNYIEDRRMFLLSQENALNNRFEMLLANKKLILGAKAAKLEALSPLAVLSRGYAIARGDSGAIKTVKQVKKNDKITMTLADGDIVASVEEVTHAK